MSNARRISYFQIIIIVLIIVFTVVLIAWFKPKQNAIDSPQVNSISPQNDPDMTAVDDLDTHNSQDTSTLVQSNMDMVTGLEKLPRSLQGTDVDGEIIIDQNKQLVVTEGLRRLFDYFLSATGEEDDAVIVARVETYIRSHTPEPAASQAITIFHQYVAYLKAIPELEKQYGHLQLQATQSGKLDLNAVAQKKRDVTTLRQQFFDKPTIDAFFSADDEYDEYSMALIRIQQNTQMTDAQKEAVKQDYISRMPDNEIKANIQQQANLNELITRTEQMQAEGASAEALFNMRKALVGAPAAKRLANLDAENANFDNRFQQYQTQKQRLLSENTDPAQVKMQIEQLEKQLFNETERKRLTGYAALQQQKAGNGK